MKKLIPERQNRFLQIPLILLSAAGFISLLFIFSGSSTEESSHKLNKDEFAKHYKIFSLQHPKKLSFAGEEVPMKLIDVKEKFDRELLVNTYWQSQTMLFIKRSHRYFPFIEEILQEENIPEDFKYLALIESGLTDVVSPAGASGFWQIMKSTGKEGGLEIYSEVDERYHLEKATRLACAYLKEAKERFGTWTLAAASYNMGMAGLANQLEKQQVNSYYDLRLNEETARYLFRIFAAKEILSSPQDYGFNFNKQDLYPPLETKEIVVTESISDLAAFAIEQGINYKTLKIFNPWLRANTLTISQGNSYTIKLPSDEQIEYFIASTDN